jgi:hypothetical protein
MPPNPANPDLPYEHVRHSGIWWANQRGIRGLGNPEYRHQFFTEREAKYMGLQFAKGARKELIAAGKGFAASFIPYIIGEGVNQWAGWSSHVGSNNRKYQMVGNVAHGVLGGAGAGAVTGMMLGGPVGAVIGGAVGAAGGGIISASNTALGHRNEDEANWMGVRERGRARSLGLNYGISDWALQAQIGMMPSRTGKLELIASQMKEIASGGKYSIEELKKRRYAMINGTEYLGTQYKKGDWNTELGRKFESMLESLESRHDSLQMQYMQTKYLQPHARPMEAVTDSYSRRGLYAGAQVNVQKTNTIIVDKMKTIIGLLESIRKNGMKGGALTSVDPTMF